MQMHMDFQVSSPEDWSVIVSMPRRWARACCTTRSRDEGEPLYVLADPAGHPFCLLVQ